MSVAAVLTAAGSGSRLGHALPKALVPVAGAPLVAHAARALLDARPADGSRVAALVVTAPAEHLAEIADALAAVRGEGVPVTVVPGGPTRQASVAAGLAALPPDADVVLVHDAARAFAPPALVARVVDAVRGGHPAVVPGLPVVDTVKRVASWGTDGGPVAETPPRDVLRAVQTPQGFARAVLERAHAGGAHRAGDEATAASDDAGLVEAAGGHVWVVPGDERAAKITTARDVVLAEALHAAPVPGGAP
ncbi:2-C-methyl-D-erythritol 4-phosphate cytidylyltransferase [Cellulomonas sp. JZ18]|uniref:2-C-methyl-D-erythritol 4-phosphate cytidylyltransferase n=1 Tax=Cellulomonas sp. JZ18 TaxID=2654191 RepID=UPI0012D39B5D|nr:2-C-methyl-D-erythritol 4-phosphate cytidylyltransferase [Cellulomonas sp. JZ18]QGQ20346.1 2-C-methyl-D-erythritol 4-phosphate cytidylyltransferase [Cellulomonas sp. JZ18]